MAFPQEKDAFVKNAKGFHAFHQMFLKLFESLLSFERDYSLWPIPKLLKIKWQEELCILRIFVVINVLIRAILYQSSSNTLGFFFKMRSLPACWFSPLSTLAKWRASISNTYFRPTPKSVFISLFCFYRFAHFMVLKCHSSFFDLYLWLLLFLLSFLLLHYHHICLSSL